MRRTLAVARRCRGRLGRMDLYDVMRTTPAVREFTDDPLPDETLHRILDHARFAPSGGNRQGTRVIVVRDQATRARLAELNEPAVRRYVAQNEGRAEPVEPARAAGRDRGGDRGDRGAGGVHEARPDRGGRPGLRGRPRPGRRDRPAPRPGRPGQRRLGLPAGLEHPARGPQRGLRRHHHHDGGRPGAGGARSCSGSRTSTPSRRSSRSASRSARSRGFAATRSRSSSRWSGSTARRSGSRQDGRTTGRKGTHCRMTTRVAQST